ncbi:hypothetical protein ZIOFF_071408 [Zingiber officinale]|uniref:Uncharacterized protein n=1 Tax=Zingiber officinale TaxID=94328 RepID=A0A8J5EQH0_ZINOF|nr:hypothetical protein ZIOFF_071408 [Zingiber officinale]
MGVSAPCAAEVADRHHRGRHKHPTGGLPSLFSSVPNQHCSCHRRTPFRPCCWVVPYFFSVLPPPLGVCPAIAASCCSISRHRHPTPVYCCISSFMIHRRPISPDLFSVLPHDQADATLLPLSFALGRHHSGIWISSKRKNVLIWRVVQSPSFDHLVPIMNIPSRESMEEQFEMRYCWNPSDQEGESGDRQQGQSTANNLLESITWHLLRDQDSEERTKPGAMARFTGGSGNQGTGRGKLAAGDQSTGARPHGRSGSGQRGEARRPASAEERKRENLDVGCRASTLLHVVLAVAAERRREIGREE